MLKSVVTLGVLAWALAGGRAWAQDQGQSTGSSARASKSPTLSVKKVTADPAPYVGKKVTVAGAVDDSIGPNAFSFKDDREAVPEDVLVISKKPIPEAQGGQKQLEKKPITVTGTLRYFNRDEVSRETGVPLDAAAFERWNGKLVLVTDGLDTHALASAGGQSSGSEDEQGRDEQRTASAGSRDKGGSSSGQADTSGQQQPQTGSSQGQRSESQTAQVSPSEKGTAPRGQKQVIDEIGTIVDATNPASLIGQQVKRTNVQVRNVVKGRGFWVGTSDDRQIFVRFDPNRMSAQSRPDVSPGDQVDLTGNLKRAPGAKEVDAWGLGKQGAAQVQRLHVYLSPDSVTVASPAGTS